MIGGPRDFWGVKGGGAIEGIVECLGGLVRDLVRLDRCGGHGLECTECFLCTPGKKKRNSQVLTGVRSIDWILYSETRGPGMTTSELFKIVDSCIEVGWFPSLVGRRYVLVMDGHNTGRAIIHREDVSFVIFCPCRVWIMSGLVRVFLGDSHAIPADLSAGVRPPWTN